MNKTVLKLPGADDFFTQEAFKTLRTNLQFCGQDIRTVVITSCNENEGKTTVTLQLGKAWRSWASGCWSSTPICANR